MVRISAAAAVVVLLSTTSFAQNTPQPFPRPGGQPQQPPSQPAVPPPQPGSPSAPQPAADSNAPTEAALGAPIFPAAQFLASYDAGRGQRYYLFGSTSGFAEVVLFYQKQIGERGDPVFKDPPTHQFFGEPFARYREETMVFPPGVTVKDWTSGGTQGYPNPRPGAQPARFPTVIMIVTPPPNATAPRR